MSDIVEAYRKRRQARLDAKKAEQRKTIEAYYARRDARIKVRQNAESGADKAIAGKNTLQSGRKNVIISKRNTDADDWIRDEHGRFAKNPDGGSDIGGQRNAHFHHGKKSGGGSGSKQKKAVIATPQQRKQIDGVLVGKTAKNGTTIKSVRDHAHNRMIERGYGASHVLGAIQTGKESNGNTPDTTVYEKGSLRVIINDKTGEIVSTVQINGKRKRGRKYGKNT